MTLERFCLKFFTRPETDIDDEIFIEIFHEWIRLRKLPGVLIDVADYRHVPEGPGIMLITHEINYAMDDGANAFGLLAQRKVGYADSQQGKILELIQGTLTFAGLLEADPRVAGRLRFEAGNFQFISNDRLSLPNSDEGFNAFKAELEAAVAVIYPGQTVSLSRVENDPRERLTITVDTGNSIDIAVLLENLGITA